MTGSQGVSSCSKSGLLAFTAVGEGHYLMMCSFLK